MAISLTCECGKKLAVKDELAGKRVKCPGCGDLLTVPSLSEKEPVKRPATAAADDEEDQDEERPLKKKKKKGHRSSKSGKSVWIAAGVGVVVLGFLLPRNGRRRLLVVCRARGAGKNRSSASGASTSTRRRRTTSCSKKCSRACRPKRPIWPRSKSLRNSPRSRSKSKRTARSPLRMAEKTENVKMEECHGQGREHHPRNPEDRIRRHVGKADFHGHRQAITSNVRRRRAFKAAFG